MFRSQKRFLRYFSQVLIKYRVTDELGQWNSLNFWIPEDLISVLFHEISLNHFRGLLMLKKQCRFLFCFIFYSAFFFFVQIQPPIFFMTSKILRKLEWSFSSCRKNPLLIHNKSCMSFHDKVAWSTSSTIFIKFISWTILKTSWMFFKLFRYLSRILCDQLLFLIPKHFSQKEFIFFDGFFSEAFPLYFIHFFSEPIVSKTRWNNCIFFKEFNIDLNTILILYSKIFFLPQCITNNYVIMKKKKNNNNFDGILHF